MVGTSESSEAILRLLEVGLAVALIGVRVLVGLLVRVMVGLLVRVVWEEWVMRGLFIRLLMRSFIGLLMRIVRSTIGLLVRIVRGIVGLLVKIVRSTIGLLVRIMRSSVRLLVRIVRGSVRLLVRIMRSIVGLLVRIVRSIVGLLVRLTVASIMRSGVISLRVIMLGFDLLMSVSALQMVEVERLRLLNSTIARLVSHWSISTVRVA